MTARIHYFTLQDEQRRQEKLDWFRETRFRDIPFQRIHPDARHNWLEQTDNDFESLLPLVEKEKKDTSVFELASLGIVTNRDEWLIDNSIKHLEEKMDYFAKTYNSSIKQDGHDENIKWSETLKRHKARGTNEQFAPEKIKRIAYRPFSIDYLYHSDLFVDRHGQSREIFKGDNLVICYTDATSQKPFMTLATNTVCDLHLVGPAAAAQCLPLYRYDKDGVRHDNITDWGLAQFRERYGSAESALTRRSAPPSPEGEGELCPSPPGRRVGMREERGGGEGEAITKLDIFHYVYAVLHNPAYRKKYELNLKRDFPRIPLYDDFRQWAAWGQALMELHLNYETAEPYPLERVDLSLDMDGPNHALPLDNPVIQGACHAPLHEPSPTWTKIPKAKLKADREQGRIIIDEQTTLSGIPDIAWEYRLGNRSALEWVLDQYKEKKPTDPTIREKFNTYRFADYKEQVIDLLRRVCTVSVETMEIVNQMA